MKKYAIKQYTTSGKLINNALDMVVNIKKHCDAEFYRQSLIQTCNTIREVLETDNVIMLCKKNREKTIIWEFDHKADGKMYEDGHDKNGVYIVVESEEEINE